jgi:hypothetical protein
MVFSLTAEHVVLEIDDLLRAAGIEWRLLKGAATAYLLYPDPSQRDIGDVDLLVRPEDFDGATDALARGGIVWREYPAPGDAHRRVGHERTLLHHLRVEVDLHRRVQAVHRRSALSQDFAFADPTTVHIAGREVAAMSLPAILVHACLHLAARETRASTLADLIRCAFDPRLDAPALFGASRQQGVLGYVDWALDRAAEVCVLPEPVRNARRQLPATTRERVTARYVQTHPSTAMFTDLLREPNRFELLRELVWPAPEFLRANDRSRAAQVAYMVSAPLRAARPQRSRVGVARRG